MFVRIARCRPPAVDRATAMGDRLQLLGVAVLAVVAAEAVAVEAAQEAPDSTEQVPAVLEAAAFAAYPEPVESVEC